RRAEDDTAGTDRSDVQCTAADLYIPHVRETAEVDPDRGALILAQAHLVPYTLRLAEGERGVTLALASGLRTYPSFEALTLGLGYADELDLHDRFWNELVAQDPAAVTRR